LSKGKNYIRTLWKVIQIEIRVTLKPIWKSSLLQISIAKNATFKEQKHNVQWTLVHKWKQKQNKQNLLSWAFGK
jgi:hypothetical protein